MHKYIPLLGKILSTIIAVALVISILSAFEAKPIELQSTVGVKHTTQPWITLDSQVLVDGIVTAVADKIDEIEEKIEEIENTPEYVEYVVKIDDKQSFSVIAEKIYGDASYASFIEEHNPDRPLLGGTILKIYPIEEMNIWALQAVINELPQGEAPDKSTPSPDVGNNLEVENMTIENAVAYIKNAQTGVDVSQFTFYANARVTGYDPHCKHCCGKTDGYTGSGRPAEFGLSCGASYDIPVGTLLYAEGYGFFRVDDRGAKRKSDIMIDIACPSHEVCRFMTGRANLYIVEYPS